MAEGMWKLGSGKATNLTETVPLVQLRFNIQNCMSLSWLTMLVVYAIITKHLLNFHFRGWGCDSPPECKALRFTPEFRHLPPQSPCGSSSFHIQQYDAYKPPNRLTKCKRLSAPKCAKGNRRKKRSSVFSPLKRHISELSSKHCFFYLGKQEQKSFLPLVFQRKRVWCPLHHAAIFHPQRTPLGVWIEKAAVAIHLTYKNIWIFPHRLERAD